LKKNDKICCRARKENKKKEGFFYLHH
jgi:hypothetical protein